MPWDIWLIFLVLAVVVPWRGRIRLKQLLARPSVESHERISLYLSTIAFQWIAVGIAAWRASAHGYTSVELGLGTGPNLFRSILAGILGTGILAGLHWMNSGGWADCETVCPHGFKRWLRGSCRSRRASDSLSWAWLSPLGVARNFCTVDSPWLHSLVLDSRFGPRSWYRPFCSVRRTYIKDVAD